MIYFIGIVCMFAFVGGIVSELHKQNKMTMAQQRERHRQQARAAAGIITGIAAGSATAAVTIIKNSGD